MIAKKKVILVSPSAMHMLQKKSLTSRILFIFKFKVISLKNLKNCNCKRNHSESIPFDDLNTICDYVENVTQNQNPNSDKTVCNSPNLALKNKNVIIEFFKKYLSLCYEFNIDRILLFHGYLPEDFVLRSIAKLESIPSVCIERTMRSDRLTWDCLKHTTIGSRQFDEFSKGYNIRIKSNQINEFALNYINNISSYKLGDHKSPENNIELQKGKLRILFLGQVYTDASIIFGTKYKIDPIDLMCKISEWCTSRDFISIIKFHPKEYEGKNPINAEKYDSISSIKFNERKKNYLINKSNLVVDDSNSFNTYDLINESDIVVTINSQSGIEAALLGKNVFSIHDAFFANKGFCHVYKNFDDLCLQLDNLINDGITPIIDQERKVREFFYLYYQIFCIKNDPLSILKKLFSDEIA